MNKTADRPYRFNGGSILSDASVPPDAHPSTTETTPPPPADDSTSRATVVGRLDVPTLVRSGVSLVGHALMLYAAAKGRGQRASDLLAQSLDPVEVVTALQDDVDELSVQLGALVETLLRKGR